MALLSTLSVNNANNITDTTLIKMMDKQMVTITTTKLINLF
jgi:hypothetical protein